MLPRHSPRTTVVTNPSSDGTTSAQADTKAAPRRSSGTSCIWPSSSAVFASSSPWRPLQRAESTPGMPRRASTSRPESSATQGIPVAAAPSRALAPAFASKVSPVSGASGYGGTVSRPTSSMPSIPARSSTRCSSRSFFALRLATSTRTSGSELLLAGLRLDRLGQGARVRLGEHFALDPAQFLDPGERGVEHRVERGTREGRAFAGALDLDEGARLGGDDVHVDLGAHVLLVGQVEADTSVDHADADGGDLARDGLRVGEAARGTKVGHRVAQCDVGAGDGGGA